MKNPFAISVAVGLILPLAIGVSVTWGSSTDTECWDEYNNRGTRMYRTVTPKDLPVDDCTPADSCLWGYRTDGRRNRLYVPHGSDPATACEDLGTDTTTSTVVVTLPPTSPPSKDRFETLPVGAALPSDSECAAAVRPASENRPENSAANATPGSGNNTTYPRVSGDFTGTTDEILQWAACKWGIDEDWVRAQIANESYWKQTAMGDFTADSTRCVPGFPIDNYDPQYDGDRSHDGECPESIGLGQVRWLYHQSAFADDNATKSSAYNVDYTYAVWRECFEGRLGWLNDVEKGAEYAAGDARGCLGVWYSGRWYTDAAIGYMERFDSTFADRTWEQPWFGSTVSASDVSSIVTTPPSTTVVPDATTAPATTRDATEDSIEGGAQFVETFDGNTGLDRFRYGVYHRDAGSHEAGRTPQFSGQNNSAVEGTWTGDHDLDCGSPATQRPLRSDFRQDTTGDNNWEPYVDFHTDELVYLCRNHLMSSMGAIAAYSVVWFSPDMVFDDVTSVSFDVNLTDLGGRQWIKWGVITDELFNSTYRTGYNDVVTVPGFMVSDVGASDLNDLTGPDRTIATWSGEGTASGRFGIGIDSERVGSANPTPNDKATRHNVSMVDNGNGTLTATVAGQSGTTAGSFPECPCRVVFYDHNYTPDKDTKPIGHTWHWDNIIIK